MITPKTKMTIKWHLGIPDGQMYHEEIIPFTDDPKIQMAFVRETIPKTKLIDRYEPNGFTVEKKYSYIEIYHEEEGDFYRVAEVEFAHYLQIGETLFKLPEEE